MSQEGWALVCPFCREFSFTPGQSAPSECPLCWVPLTPDTVRNAQEAAERVSMSAKGPRAETSTTEQNAQCGGVGARLTLAPLVGAVGGLLTAVLRALVGRGAWSRKTARERATRPRSR